MSNTFKDQSRVSWQPKENRQVTNEEINTGCLQRIADATEAMAQGYIALQNQRDQYKRWYEQKSKESERMARRIAALQGVITKLKKLIPIILIALLASCVPAQRGPYGCPKYVNIAFDTIPGSGLPRSEYTLEVKEYSLVGHKKPDTISVMLQVSNSKPMRVCYAIPGYVVIRDDTTYLDRNKKELDPRLMVWRFVRTEFKIKRRTK